VPVDRGSRSWQRRVKPCKKARPRGMSRRGRAERPRASALRKVPGGADAGVGPRARPRAGCRLPWIGCGAGSGGECRRWSGLEKPESGAALTDAMQE